MNYSPSTVYRTNIEKILLLFCQLTKVNLAFIDNALQLFDRKRNISDSQRINTLFSEKALTFFPLITNKKIAGIFIANINANSSETLSLYQTSLETIAHKILGAYFKNIAILSPLKIDQLNQSIALFQFISSNYRGRSMSFNKVEKTGQKAEIENINNALAYTEERINQKITLTDVSKHTFLSLAYLSRLFKEYFLVNFSDYIRIRKIALAQEKLILTKKSINGISKEIGFSRASYFNKVFKEKTGVTPLQFRKKYQGHKIYTIHREIEWKNNVSVYAVSQHYFQEKEIPTKTQSLNGSPYISSIGEFSTHSDSSGWVYLVDGKQPNVLPGNLYVRDKSVIQWIHINL